MRVADQRLYAGKQSSRASASRQSTDVLLSVLAERHPGFGEHSSGVAALALRTAQRLGLDTAETRVVGLAAELHDIGKMAIPDAILDKALPARHGRLGVHAAPTRSSVSASWLPLPRWRPSRRWCAPVTNAWTDAAIRTASRAPTSPRLAHRRRVRRLRCDGQRPSLTASRSPSPTQRRSFFAAPGRSSIPPSSKRSSRRTPKTAELTARAGALERA